MPDFASGRYHGPYHWAGDRGIAVDLLLDRWDAAERDARQLDDEFDGDDAVTAVVAVAAAFGDPDEDDAHTSVIRAACCVRAMEDAVLDVRAEYVEAAQASPMHWGASGWDAEAFPRVALGL